MFSDELLPIELWMDIMFFSSLSVKSELLKFSGNLGECSKSELTCKDMDFMREIKCIGWGFPNYISWIALDKYNKMYGKDTVFFMRKTGSYWLSPFPAIQLPKLDIYDNLDISNRYIGIAFCDFVIFFTQKIYRNKILIGRLQGGHYLKQMPHKDYRHYLNTFPIPKVVFDNILLKNVQGEVIAIPPSIQVLDLLKELSRTDNTKSFFKSKKTLCTDLSDSVATNNLVNDIYIMKRC
mgnify:CR=1 FL=1